MRSRNDIATASEFAYLFEPTIRDWNRLQQLQIADPPPRLLEFSITDKLASVASRKTETQRESYNVAILFEISCVLTVKHDCIRGVINQGPFFFGIVEIDVSHE